MQSHIPRPSRGSTPGKPAVPMHAESPYPSHVRAPRFDSAGAADIIGHPMRSPAGSRPSLIPHIATKGPASPVSASLVMSDDIVEVKQCPASARGRKAASDSSEPSAAVASNVMYTKSPESVTSSHSNKEAFGSNRASFSGVPWESSTNVHSLHRSPGPTNAFERQKEAKLWKLKLEEKDKLIASLKSDLVAAQNRLRVAEQGRSDWKMRYNQLKKQERRLSVSDEDLDNNRPKLGDKVGESPDREPSTAQAFNFNSCEFESNDFDESNCDEDGLLSSPARIIRRDSNFYMYNRPAVLSSVEDYAQYVEVLECQLGESKERNTYLSNDLSDCRRRVSELELLLGIDKNQSSELDSTASNQLITKDVIIEI